jgi:ribosomal protein S18 acetylase RimI-like enzyme
MVGIRPPSRDEGPIVAELVLQSDCGMLPALFGPRVRSLVAWLQRFRGNPWSSENTLAIVDEAGSVVGALIGTRCDIARTSNLPTALLLLRWYGPSLLARLSRLRHAGRALEDLAPDDFYLSHIAVLPTRRDSGFGRALLLEGERRAGRLGCSRVVLDVEEKNEGARTFYDRLGYHRESDVLIDLGKHGSFRFLRLAKELPDP